MKYVAAQIAIVALLLSACQPATPSTEAVIWPEHVQVAQGLDADKAEVQLDVAETYYAFWNTGDPALARAALSPDFIDLNLPDGRPQGVEGPIIASKGFRTAVPDLKMTAEQVYVLDNKVIGHLHFTGTFTGQFADIQGQGQAVDFRAVDIYTIEDGKITHNWHLEDNLTLMEQLGALGN